MLSAFIPPASSATQQNTTPSLRGLNRAAVVAVPLVQSAVPRSRPQDSRFLRSCARGSPTAAGSLVAEEFLRNAEVAWYIPADRVSHRSVGSPRRGNLQGCWSHRSLDSAPGPIVLREKWRRSWKVHVLWQRPPALLRSLHRKRDRRGVRSHCFPVRPRNGSLSASLLAGTNAPFVTKTY